MCKSITISVLMNGNKCGNYGTIYFKDVFTTVKFVRNLKKNPNIEKYQHWD